MAQEGPIASPTLVPGSITPVTSDRLLGRDTAGTGAAEQLTVGGGLEFTGSGGVQRSALTGDVTASAGSNTTAIANLAVTDAKVAAANKDGIAGTASMRTLGTGAQQAAAGNHDHTGVYQPASDALASLVTIAVSADGFPINQGDGTYLESAITEGGKAFVAGTATAAQVAALGAESAWTYVVLGSDFTTSQNTAQDTGLKFTPAVSKTYIVEASLGLRSGVAGIAPRPGVAWNTGNDDGWARLQWTESTSVSFALGTTGTDFSLDPVLPVDATSTYHCELKATIVAGSGASGSFIATLKSETAANNVTCKKGSWLRYKAIT